MPEFILETAGEVKPPRGVAVPPPARALTWSDLDAFTQGYIEALFFTNYTPQTTHADALTAKGKVRAKWRADYSAGRLDGEFPESFGFADLAPLTLACILTDCAAFQRDHGALIEAAETADRYESERLARAGRDFWYTRNGHGCGFWDGDWPEPYDKQLTAAAKAFGQVDAYLGDDGKAWLS